jgi:hypothetical protein
MPEPPKGVGVGDDVASALKGMPGWAKLLGGGLGAYGLYNMLKPDERPRYPMPKYGAGEPEKKPSFTDQALTALKDTPSYLADMPAALAATAQSALTGRSLDDVVAENYADKPVPSTHYSVRPMQTIVRPTETVREVVREQAPLEPQAEQTMADVYRQQLTESLGAPPSRADFLERIPELSPDAQDSPMARRLFELAKVRYDATKDPESRFYDPDVPSYSPGYLQQLNQAINPWADPPRVDIAPGWSQSQPTPESWEITKYLSSLMGSDTPSDRFNQAVQEYRKQQEADLRASAAQGGELLRR